MNYSGLISFFALLVAFPLGSYSQGDTFLLKSFYGRAIGQQVHLYWVMQGGSQCNGTRILRSADGETWSEVGMIGGICGSTEVDEAYDFRDSFPMLNTRNYYRTELIGLGFSQVVWVDVFNPDQQGFVVTSQQSGKITVRLLEHTQEPFAVALYAMDGRLLYSAENLYQEVTFSAHHLPVGVAVLRVYTHSGSFAASRRLWLGGR